MQLGEYKRHTGWISSSSFVSPGGAFLVTWFGFSPEPAIHCMLEVLIASLAMCVTSYRLQITKINTVSHMRAVGVRRWQQCVLVCVCVCGRRVLELSPQPHQNHSIKLWSKIFSRSLPACGSVHIYVYVERERVQRPTTLRLWPYPLTLTPFP